MAAACGSLLPENSTALLETTFSSWGQIMALKQTEQHSTFTQIFGELRFKGDIPMSKGAGDRRRSYSFSSSSNSESLQLCTEGLGYESLDDVEDLEGELFEDDEKKQVQYHHHHPSNNLKPGGGMIMRTKSANVDHDFPPPISCMGKTGKPWAGFKSYRYGGRFILKEVRVPTHEFLHASRENGRLKLHILVPNDQTREAAKEEDAKDDHHHPDDSIDKCCRVQTSST